MGLYAMGDRSRGGLTMPEFLRARERACEARGNCRLDPHEEPLRGDVPEDRLSWPTIAAAVLWGLGVLALVVMAGHVLSDLVELMRS